MRPASILGTATVILASVGLWEWSSRSNPANGPGVQANSDAASESKTDEGHTRWASAEQVRRGRGLEEAAASAVGFAPQDRHQVQLEAQAVAPPRPAAPEPHDAPSFSVPSSVMNAFEKESTDTAASERLEDNLAALLPAHVLSDAVNEVDCRKSACLVDLANTAGGETLAAGVSNLLGGSAFVVPTEDGEHVRVYVSKDIAAGSKLPEPAAD